MERTQLLFRTAPGSQALSGGTTTTLTSGFPNGIAVFDYPIIRILFGNRTSSGSSVTFNLIMLQGQELIGRLDSVTLSPGESFTGTYEVPGLALIIDASNNGTSDSYVDALLYGFGPNNNWNC